MHIHEMAWIFLSAVYQSLTAALRCFSSCMEIPAYIFFIWWTLVGAVFFKLGLDVLNKTDFPNSVSPLVMSLFTYSFAISICHSSNYALLLRPKLRISVVKYYSWVLFTVYSAFLSCIAGESFAWYFPSSLMNLFVFLIYFYPDMKSFIPDNQFDNKLKIGSLVFPLLPVLYFQFKSLGYLSILASNLLIILQIPFTVVSGERTSIHLHLFAVSTLFMGSWKTMLFPSLVLTVSSFTSVVWAAVCGDERFRKWLPEVSPENRIMSRLKNILKNNGKVIEFAIGMGGTILFQNFFRLTSFDQVVAFLYFAVAWMANLALLMFPQDLGIFNFFLSNVIVGCTVSQFGLRGTTWIAYGASILLYIVRLKLEALSLVNRGEDEAAVVVWNWGERMRSDFGMLSNTLAT